MQRYICQSVGAGADAVVSCTANRKGRLRGVQLWCAGNSATTASQVSATASLDGVAPAILAGANNGLTRILGSIVWTINVGAAGQSVQGLSQYIPCDEPIEEGQALYLHVDQSGTVIAQNCGAIFHVE